MDANAGTTGGNWMSLLGSVVGGASSAYSANVNADALKAKAKADAAQAANDRAVQASNSQKMSTWLFFGIGGAFLLVIVLVVGLRK
jgi:hypothetical protein